VSRWYEFRTPNFDLNELCQKIFGSQFSFVYDIEFRLVLLNISVVALPMKTDVYT